MLSLFSQKILATMETNPYLDIEAYGFTYISGIGFHNKKVNYTLKNGLALFEGDILLTSKGNISSLKQSKQNHIQYSIARNDTPYKWKNNTIPYQFDPNVSEDTKAMVVSAMVHWSNNTSMQFIEINATQYPDFVHITSQDYACYSHVGKVGGVQDLNIVYDCGWGTAVHELGHTLGLWHEQSRSDRNQYIKILYENIESGFEDNFDQRILDGTDLWKYDYNSIMHYGDDYFNAVDTNLKTIETIPKGITIGQRNAISTGDKRGISYIYGHSNLNAPKSLLILKHTLRQTSVKLRFTDNSEDEKGFILYVNGSIYKKLPAKPRHGSFVYVNLKGLIKESWNRVDVVSYNAMGRSSVKSIAFQTHKVKSPKSVVIYNIKKSSASLRFVDQSHTEKGFVVYVNGKKFKTLAAKKRAGGFVYTKLVHLRISKWNRIDIYAYDDYGRSNIVNKAFQTY